MGKSKGQQVIYCPQRWWKESEIEAEILRDLSLIEYDEKVAAEIRTTLVKEYEERREISEALVKDSKAENSRLQELVKNLIRKIAEEKDAQIEKEFRKMVNETREKITQNEDQIARAEEAVEIDTDEIIDVLSVARNLKEQYLSLDEEDQIKLLKLVFKEIRAFRGEITGVMHGKKVQGKIKADHLDFVFNEPFDELIELGFGSGRKNIPCLFFQKT